MRSMITSWKDKMTDWRDFESGKPFKFIVHNLTKDDFYDDFWTSIVSASLITDKAMGVYGQTKIGFILYPSNILAASYKDFHTKNESNNTEDIIEGESIIMEPDFIEKKLMEITTSENGEILNYKNKNIYSEVVIEGFCPVAIYAITNGEGIISKEYRKANYLNRGYDFPLIEIDKSIYRRQNNLEPLSYEERINLLANLLYLYSKNHPEFKYDNNFIIENFERIYQYYIYLKENNEYDPSLMFDELERIINCKVKKIS